MSPELIEHLRAKFPAIVKVKTDRHGGTELVLTETKPVVKITVRSGTNALWVRVFVGQRFLDRDQVPPKQAKHFDTAWKIVDEIDHQTPEVIGSQPRRFAKPRSKGLRRGRPPTRMPTPGTDGDWLLKLRQEKRLLNREIGNLVNRSAEQVNNWIYVMSRLPSWVIDAILAAYPDVSLPPSRRSLPPWSTTSGRIPARTSRRSFCWTGSGKLKHEHERNRFHVPSLEILSVVDRRTRTMLDSVHEARGEPR
jgi:hypothetical protein